MFTVVRTTTNLSLDERFIKHPAATFFVTVEGDGMADHGDLEAGFRLFVALDQALGDGALDA